MKEYAELIKMPRQLTVALSDQIITLCNEANNHHGPLTFDFSDVYWTEPFGLTAISTTLAKCCRKPRPIQYVPPQDDKVRSYLKEIGFDEIFLRGGRTQPRSTSLELKRLTQLDPGYIDALLDIMGASITMSKNDKFQLRLHLIELLTNGFDHGKSEVGCFVCAQWYPRIKIIRVSVADGGIGIMTSLNNYGKYRVSSHSDAIRKAVEKGVTTRTQKTGGIGLTFVKKYIRANGGLLTIITGDAKVNFYPNKIEEKSHEYNFDGTIVDIKIHTGTKTPVSNEIFNETKN
jgi:signal transduction histidine kinase